MSATDFRTSAFIFFLKQKVYEDELPLVSISDSTFDDFLFIAKNIRFVGAVRKRKHRMAIDLNTSVTSDVTSLIKNSDNFSRRRRQAIYLSQKDFIHGTLRITEPGLYIITEDIVFNFNAPSEEEIADELFSPNTIDIHDLYWFPTTEQSVNFASDSKYPGTYSFHGAYSLGFFAGITIETHGVVLDLNGCKLSMHYTFYLQQRYAYFPSQK